MRKLTALLLALLLWMPPAFVHAQSTDGAVTEKNAPLSLLSELYTGQNTLAFSPLSLSVALGMAAEGADGSTRAQLDDFLGDKRPGWAMLEDLAFSGVSLANTAFIRPILTLLPDYEDALEDTYDAAPEFMDEGNAMQQVNSWVSEHTAGLIDAILAEEPGEQTLLLLISALHMKADWSSPFDPSDTQFTVFHAPEGDIEVSSMNQTARFRYGEINRIQSVLLPYASSSLEMLILLPEDGNLQALIDSLAAAPDEFIQEHLPTETSLVRLSLPNVHAESSFELKDALIASGVTDAFSPDTADFSALAENAADLHLHIGSVLQKVSLSVDERGTEAAAVTQVSLEAGAIAPETPVVMNVDRPFMMLIYDPVSGYVLFAACINNPA